MSNLKGQGVVVNLDTSGISKEVWNDLYVGLSNVVSEYKVQAKKAELELSRTIGQSNRNAPALKLVELKGISTWLEWKRSWNEVQDIYTGNPTKKAVILSSLRDRLDIQCCKSLDLPDILKYLEAKYNDPTLVIALLDKLLRMKPPTSNVQVYNNLTEFRNTYQLITYHKCEERVDRNFRQRLTPLLFNGYHMFSFMKQVHEYEDKLKEDNNLSDELSDIEGTVAAEIEDKRRTFWFNEIERSYSFIRKIVVSFKTQDTRNDSQVFSTTNRTNKKRNNRDVQQVTGGSSNNSHNYSISGAKCPLCLQFKHSGRDTPNNFAKCFKFRHMDYPSRKQAVSEHSYCYRCLRPRRTRHEGGICKLQQEYRDTDFRLICKLCTPPSEQHHRLLHPPNAPGRVQDQGRPSRPGQGGGGNDGKGSNFYGQSKKKKGSAQTSGSSGRNFQANSSGDSAATQNQAGSKGTQATMATTFLFPSLSPTVLPACDIQTHAISKFGHGPTNFIEIKDNYRKFIMSLPVNTLFTLLAISVVRLTVKDQENEALALLDCGSTSSYICKSLVAKLKPQYVTTWTGTLGTISGSSNEHRDMFSVGIKTINGEIRNVRLLETPDGSLGTKNKVPQPLLEAMALQFGISPSTIQNKTGVVGVLLGLDTVDLLLERVPTSNLSNSFFKGLEKPNIILCTTSLSSQYVLIGNFWSRVTDERGHNTGSFFINTRTSKQDHDINTSSNLAYSVSKLKDLDTVQFAKNKCKAHGKCFKLTIPGFHHNNAYHQKRLMLSLYSAFIASNLKRLYKARPLAPGKRVLVNSFSNSNLPWTPYDCQVTRSAKSENRCNYHKNQCLTILTAQPDQTNKVSCYLRKTNPILDQFFDSGQMTAVLCGTCLIRTRHCISCKYLSSNISLQDVTNLNIYREHVVVQEADGHKRLLVDFPLTTGALQYFHPRYSNYKRVKENTMKLVARLHKRGFLDAFHQQILKAVEQNHMEFVPGFDHTKHHHLFLAQNYVRKDSESTPLRITSNTQTANLSGYSVNQVIVSAPSTINLIPSVMIGWRLFMYACISDIKEFYRQLWTTEQSNNLRCLFWFNCQNSNQIIEEKLEPVVLRYIRATFGDIASPIFSEIAMRDHVAPECEHDNSSRILRDQRVVDDILYSCPDLLSVERVMTDITAALARFGFQIKYNIKTGDQSDKKIKVLGVKWSPQEDLIYVDTTLNATRKQRGLHVGENLSKENVPDTKLSRDTLARLAGELWSPDGVGLGPAIVAMRLMFSYVCECVEDWYTPLSHVDAKMDSQFKLVLSKLTKMNEEILPYKRVVIPAGYKMIALNISSDSGCRAYGICLHIVSHNSDDNKYHSALVAVRSKLHSFSVPMGESNALVFASKVVSEFIMYSGISTLLEELNHTVKINFLLDAANVTYNLSPEQYHSEIIIRNGMHTFYRICQDIVNRFKNVEITVLHIRGSTNPSDKVSKMFINIIEQCNSKLYRMGHPDSLDIMWPNPARIFLMFRRSLPPMYKSPVLDNDKSSEVDNGEEEHILDVPAKKKKVKNQPSASQCSLISVYHVMTRARTRKFAQQLNDSEDPGQKKPDSSGTELQRQVSSGELLQDLNPLENQPSSLPLQDDQPWGQSPEANDKAAIVSKLKMTKFSKEFYTKLFLNNSCIAKMLNVLLYILKWFYKDINLLQYEMQSYFTFLLLIKNHQYMYPLGKMYKLNMVMDDDKILRFINRLNFDDTQILGISYALPVVNINDHDLTYLLIKRAHIFNQNAFGDSIHLNLIHTLLALTSGSRAVHIVRAKQAVQNYIEKCKVCIRIQNKNIKVLLGSPRFLPHMTKKNILFDYIGADPIGPCSINLNGSIHTFYILVIKCYITQSINMVYTENLTYDALMMALRNHVSDYQRFSKLVVDCGSSLTPKLLGKTWTTLFGSQYKPDVVRLASNHQLLSISESGIKILRRFFRSMFVSRENIHLTKPTSMSKLLLTIKMVKEIYNSKPIFYSENDYTLSPSHFMHPAIFSNISSDDLENNLSYYQSTLDVLFSQLCLSTQLFIKFLKTKIGIDNKFQSQRNSQKCFIFKDKDFVLIKRKKLHYGVIKKAGLQHSTVLSSETYPASLFQIHNERLILIMRTKNQIDTQNLDNVLDKFKYNMDRRRGYVDQITQ